MSAPAEREYGRLGRIGIGTPQANPTVEAEFAILLPRACSLHVTRMTSPAAEPAERLKDYLVGLDSYLSAFDTLRPDVFGFACTGSSYLLGAETEQKIIASAADHCGYPIETAARAILWGLERLRARRIAAIVPYPEFVIDAALQYWAAAGIDVRHVERIALHTADTRGVYELVSSQVIAALQRLVLDGMDAVLVTGTGMPSLAALRESFVSVPVLSSNSCLAARLLDLHGRPELLESGSLDIREWRQRFDESRWLTL